MTAFIISISEKLFKIPRLLNAHIAKNGKQCTDPQMKDMSKVYQVSRTRRSRSRIGNRYRDDDGRHKIPVFSSNSPGGGIDGISGAFESCTQDTFSKYIQLCMQRF